MKLLATDWGQADVWMIDKETGTFARFGDPIDHHGAADVLPAPSGREQIFLMNWGVESNDNADRGYSEGAADAFVAALIRHQQGPDHSDDFFLDRIHFIGHSRGTVVTSEMVERVLALRNSRQSLPADQNWDDFGLAIDVTYLDPHPVWHASRADEVNILDLSERLDQVVGWHGVRSRTTYYQSKELLPCMTPDEPLPGLLGGLAQPDDPYSRSGRRIYVGPGNSLGSSCMVFRND